MIDAEQHLDRLDRSLREISLPLDRSRASLRLVMGEVLRRNRVSGGMLYIQVTRGAAEWDRPLTRELCTRYRDY